jgi:hypothetical protein
VTLRRARRIGFVVLVDTLTFLLLAIFGIRIQALKKRKMRGPKNRLHRMGQFNLCADLHRLALSQVMRKQMQGMD